MATIRLPGSIRLGNLQRRGYTLTIASRDRGAYRLTAVLRGRTPATRRSRARRPTLVRRTTSFDDRASLTLRLPRGVRASIRRGSRLELAVAVTDDAGNRWAQAVRILVR